MGTTSKQARQQRHLPHAARHYVGCAVVATHGLGVAGLQWAGLDILVPNQQNRKGSSTERLRCRGWHVGPPLADGQLRDLTYPKNVAAGMGNDPFKPVCCFVDEVSQHLPVKSAFINGAGEISRGSATVYATISRVMPGSPHPPLADNEAVL